jgi:matrixin
MSRALPIISLLTAAAIGADALFGARPLVLGAKASAHIREAAGTLAPALGVDERRAKRDVRAIQRELRRRAAGTYIGEMLLSRDSSLARWPERRARPIRVWIQPSSDLTDWTATYVDEVYAAFDEWDALDLPVSFTYVADSTDAEVHVTWIDYFREPISGRTKWARDDDWWITDAAIVLAVHHHKGDVLDEDAMRAMALHEIGHLLGLDHTYDVRSIMAPKVRVRTLSSADKATVRLLYTLPPGAVR